MGVNVWKVVAIVFIVLFIVSIGFNFYLYNLSTQDNTILPEEKAMLFVELYDWGYNENKYDELLFNYWVHNFGNVEAKNIKVICSMFEDGIKKTYSATDNYGNLASRSSEFGEFTPTKNNLIDYNKEYAPVCHIESCDNCEILYKRIPELIESYEG